MEFGESNGSLGRDGGMTTGLRQVVARQASANLR